MMDLVLVSNLLFDAFMFALASYLYMNYIADRDFSFGEALISGSQFAVALILSYLIMREIKSFPPLMHEIRRELGVDALAVFFLCVYVSFQFGFDFDIVAPIILIAIIAALGGTAIKNLLVASNMLPLELSAGIQKKILKPDIPAMRDQSSVISM